MENTVLKRLRLFIKEQNISNKLFCKNIDLPEATLKSLFQRNSYPTTEILIKILNEYPYLSLEWLLSGQGEMLNKDGVKLDESSKNKARLTPEMSSNKEEMNFKKTPGYSEMIDKISELSGKLAVRENEVHELKKRLEQKAELADRSVTKEVFPDHGK